MDLFKKSYITLVVLGILKEKEMYGYELAKTIKQRSNGEFEIKGGTLYPLLHYLEEADLIKGEWRTSEEGPDRQYFQLTAKGKKTFEQEKQTLTKLLDIGQETG